jgi:hypothetical protein
MQISKRPRRLNSFILALGMLIGMLLAPAAAWAG